jgi:putative copper resistance protein D
LSVPGSEVAVGACVRWLDLLALAAVVGGLALEGVVLPSSVGADAPSRLRLARATTAALLALAGASLAEVVVRAHTMAGGDARAALAAVPLVLRMTHFGRVWCLRAAGLAALLLLRTMRARVGSGIALAIAFGVALTTTLTGHAADGGDATAAVLVDWLHVAAASVWTGGLFGLVLAVLPAARESPDASWVGETVRRFSRIAAVSAAVVLASGAYNAWTSVAAIAALWTSAYGRVLAAKLALVAGMLGVAAVNRYRMVPAFAPAADDAGTRRAAVALATWVVREAALVLVVFACTALLGQLPPPRHDAGTHAPDHAVHGDTTRPPFLHPHGVPAAT